MNLNEPLRIAWEEVHKKYLDKVIKGEYQVFNGVLRDVKSGHKIVKHLPFKPFDADAVLDGSKSLMQVAQSVEHVQSAMTFVTAVSTATILGTIIIATAYISKKIDKLHIAINQMQKELENQNRVFYMEKIANYFGAIEYLRELITIEGIATKNSDIIVMQLSDLGVQRNQLHSFVDSLIYGSDDFPEKDKAMAVDFINTSLELIPKGAFIESQAAYTIERFSLGDRIRDNALLKHEAQRGRYIGWANDKIREVRAGKAGTIEEVLRLKKTDIERMAKSEENKMLLAVSV